MNIDNYHAKGSNVMIYKSFRTCILLTCEMDMRNQVQCICDVCICWEKSYWIL